MKRIRERFFVGAVALVSVWLLAGIAWALVGGTNISMQNGTISVTGPPALTSCATNGVPYGQGSSAMTCTSAGSANTVFAFVSGAPAFAPVVNAMIDAAAAIARSKIAAGTANHVVINDGSGNLSSEATLAGSRGGLGATQPTCASNERLTCGGTTCTCSAIPQPILWGTSVTDLTTNQTVYSGGGTADTTEARAEIPVGAGTFSNLRCMETTAAGASNTVSCTLRTGTCNGTMSDATTTCSITGGASAASCSDSTHVTTTTAGQCATLKIATPATLSNSQYVTWSLERLS